MLGLMAFAVELPSMVRCCSYFEIEYPAKRSSGTGYAIGRTMELANVLGHTTYNIELVPRNASGGSLGYVAPMNILELPPTYMKLPFEGMNEEGFTASAQYFQESVYEAPDDGVESLSSAFVVQRLLEKCGTVEEALAYLASVRVVGGDPIQGGPGLHWALTDPSGRSVVVEYLRGQRVVHENTPRVMTNDPNLEWHWRNLNTYTNLNPSWPNRNDFMSVEIDGVGRVPRPVGHGWNLYGLPGDLSPPSRFVRLFYLRGYAMHAAPPRNISESVVLGTALLNHIMIPFGTVAFDPTDKTDNPEYTPYGVLKFPKDKYMLIRGYRSTQWRMIDFTRVDFSKAQKWPLEDGSMGIQDITDTGNPSAPTADVFQSVI